MNVAVYTKEFDRWNQTKKQTENKLDNQSFYFYEREVWWCTIGVNLGVEVDGKNTDFERPVLIVKKFNGLMFWGIPLTSKSKDNPYVIKVEHELGASFAVISQLRLFSSKRILRKIGMINERSFLEVKDTLKNSL